MKILKEFITEMSAEPVIHKINKYSEAVCRSTGGKGAPMVPHNRSRTWKSVTCKRCLKQKPNEVVNEEKDLTELEPERETYYMQLQRQIVLARKGLKDAYNHLEAGKPDTAKYVLRQAWNASSKNETSSRNI